MDLWEAWSEDGNETVRSRKRERRCLGVIKEEKRVMKRMESVGGWGKESSSVKEKEEGRYLETGKNDRHK